MAKFDLRKHIPYLGTMIVLDDSSKNQEKITDSINTVEKLINNLEEMASIEYKNEEIYNRILNNLVEEYGADKDTGIIEIEREYLGINEETKDVEYVKIVRIDYEERRKVFGKSSIRKEFFYKRKR